MVRVRGFLHSIREKAVKETHELWNAIANVFTVALVHEKERVKGEKFASCPHDANNRLGE